MSPTSPTGHGFAPTRWSVVLAAGGAGAQADRRAALEELVRAYWPPLYAYLRRDGHAPDRAEDLTQAFFARLIEKDDLRTVDPAKGRFRSYVLACLKHFVLNEREKERALKRGGGARLVSWDAADAESRYSLEPVDSRTPEDVFNRRWALTVLDVVLEGLRAEYVRRGQERVFDELKTCLAGGAADGWSAVGSRLGLSEGGVRVAAHRMRGRYRELLRAEVAQTVADPSMVEDELRDLIACLSDP